MVAFRKSFSVGSLKKKYLRLLRIFSSYCKFMSSKLSLKMTNISRKKSKDTAMSHIVYFVSGQRFLVFFPKNSKLELFESIFCRISLLYRASVKMANTLLRNSKKNRMVTYYTFWAGSESFLIVFLQTTIWGFCQILFICPRR